MREELHGLLLRSTAGARKFQGLNFPRPRNMRSGVRGNSSYQTPVAS